MNKFLKENRIPLHYHLCLCRHSSTHDSRTRHTHSVPFVFQQRSRARAVEQASAAGFPQAQPSPSPNTFHCPLSLCVRTAFCTIVVTTGHLGKRVNARIASLTAAGSSSQGGCSPLSPLPSPWGSAGRYSFIRPQLQLWNATSSSPRARHKHPSSQSTCQAQEWP